MGALYVECNQLGMGARIFQVASSYTNVISRKNIILIPIGCMIAFFGSFDSLLNFSDI